MQKAFFLLGLLGIVSFNLPVLAQNNASSTTFESYRQECLKRAIAQGLAQDVATDLCNCTITKFRSTYTLQQFQALVQKAKTDKTSARTLAKVGEDCFDRVLYQ